jgi:hypothetical protein
MERNYQINSISNCIFQEEIPEEILEETPEETFETESEISERLEYDSGYEDLDDIYDMQIDELGDQELELELYEKYCESIDEREFRDLKYHYVN